MNTSSSISSSDGPSGSTHKDINPSTSAAPGISSHPGGSASSFTGSSLHRVLKALDRHVAPPLPPAPLEALLAVMVAPLLDRKLQEAAEAAAAVGAPNQAEGPSQEAFKGVVCIQLHAQGQQQQLSQLQQQHVSQQQQQLHHPPQQQQLSQLQQQHPPRQQQQQQLQHPPQQQQQLQRQRLGELIKQHQQEVVVEALLKHAASFQQRAKEEALVGGKVKGRSSSGSRSMHSMDLSSSGSSSWDSQSSGSSRSGNSGRSRSSNSGSMQCCTMWPAQGRGLSPEHVLMDMALTCIEEVSAADSIC